MVSMAAARPVPFRCDRCEQPVSCDLSQVSLHVHMTDDSRSFVLWTCPTCGPRRWYAWPIVRSALVDSYHVRVLSIPEGLDARPSGLCRDDLIDLACWDGADDDLLAMTREAVRRELAHG